MTSAERVRLMRAREKMKGALIEVEEPRQHEQWRICLWCFEPFKTEKYSKKKYCGAMCKKMAGSKGRGRMRFRAEVRSYYDHLACALRKVCKAKKEGFAPIEKALSQNYLEMAFVEVPRLPPVLTISETKYFQPILGKFALHLGELENRGFKMAKILKDRIAAIVPIDPESPKLLRARLD
jgi:hypothetical protein